MIETFFLWNEQPKESRRDLESQNLRRSPFSKGERVVMTVYTALINQKFVFIFRRNISLSNKSKVNNMLVKKRKALFACLRIVSQKWKTFLYCLRKMKSYNNFEVCTTAKLYFQITGNVSHYTVLAATHRVHLSYVTSCAALAVVWRY